MRLEPTSMTASEPKRGRGTKTLRCESKSIVNRCLRTLSAPPKHCVRCYAKFPKWRLAIPPSLIASELFGYEKGAFTGATQRRLGRFESANSGTIFLDEIGDLPPEVQIALLRVLQEREIERIGGNKAIPVDVTVLAATHHDLSALVTEGKFREDLLYRLNVVPIEMPSLRERAADIPLLVEYFIDRFSRKAGKRYRSIDRKSLKLFQAYRWPGNVRELQNVIERAVVLCEGETFSVDEAWLKRELPPPDRRPA